MTSEIVKLHSQNSDYPESYILFEWEFQRNGFRHKLITYSFRIASSANVDISNSSPILGISEYFKKEENQIFCKEDERGNINFFISKILPLYTEEQEIPYNQLGKVKLFEGINFMGKENVKEFCLVDKHFWNTQTNASSQNENNYSSIDVKEYGKFYIKTSSYNRDDLKDRNFYDFIVEELEKSAKYSKFAEMMPPVESNFEEDEPTVINVFEELSHLIDTFRTSPVVKEYKELTIEDSDNVSIRMTINNYGDNNNLEIRIDEEEDEISYFH